MTLRTRLVLWLLLMSVVPLGAVTYYSYRNSANALRVAAAHEADLLATDMTSRMQLVTAELSARVQKLLTMPDTTPVAQLASAKKPAAKTTSAVTTATSPATPADLAAATQATVTDTASEAARALGDAALLLNSVELQGVRTVFRGDGGRGGGRGDNRGDGAAPTSQNSNEHWNLGVNNTAGGRRTGWRGARDGQPPFLNRLDPPQSPTAPTAPVATPSAAGGAAAPATTTSGANGATGSATPGAGQTPNAAAAPGTQGAAQTVVVTNGNTDDKFVVDVGSIAKEMTKRFAPDGIDKMTPEQRQQMNRDIGMRIMGITEGLRMGAAELQRKAEAAKQKAADDAKEDAKADAKADAKTGTATPVETKTKTTLSGNKLDVTMERGGKVVHAANAEVNLENLMMTVFSTTRHDQGELPFAVAKDGKIYAQSDADREKVRALGDAVLPTAPLGTLMKGDWIIVTSKDPSGSGLRFGIARPVGDSLSALRKTAGRNAGLGLLFIGLALIVVVPVSQGLTKNLSNLTDAAGRIAKGDFSARVPVRGGGEVSQLASAFNSMAADIQKQQEQLVGQERLKRELELGRQIQSEMLPREALHLGLTEVKGMSIPAREVGGDFFNYFALDNGDVALLVGDVSGKGVGAALLMANFQAALRTRLTLGHDLASIADALDREVAATAPRGLYTTLFMGILSPSTKRLRYVNAGHNPQFALHASGLERLSSTGTPIGLLPGRGYTQNEVQLSSGDFLFFYTDGVVEAENEAGDMFGPERLEALLLTAARAKFDGIDAVLQHVETSVKHFRGTREPFDDATSMVVRVG